MNAESHHRISLMPLIVFAAFSFMAWLPLVTTIHVEAAMPEPTRIVTVEPGDTVWSIAARHASAEVDINALTERIVTANHLVNASLSPGQRLRIPG
jgi:predicted Zn-dependent protease